MRNEPLHSCPELIDYINKTGFLPLLSMGITGWSAEEVMDEDCQYTRLPDGNGRFGNGKVPSSRKAVVHTASFSKVKPHSSVANGGPTSATTGEVFSLIQRPEALKKVFSMY